MTPPESQPKYPVATAAFWGAVIAMVLFGLWAAVVLPLISARAVLLPAGIIALIVAAVMIVVYTRTARR